METIKVLIAVKSKALARVIQHVLQAEAGISGIDFADSEQRLMEQAQRLRPGLIIVNSRLLGRDAGVALTQLKRANPQSKLLLTCNFEEFRRSIDPGTVDARVLDETLVQQLPAIARRFANRPRGKNSIVQTLSLVLALCVFSLLFAGSAFAQLMDSATHAPSNYYTLGPPAAGSSYVDPVFGSTIKRMSNSLVEPNVAGSGTLPFISDEYSTMSPFNSDNSRILGFHFSYFGLYDSSGGFTKNLNVCASCEPRWSRTDPNVLYFISGNQLKRLDVSTDAVSVVHTFGEYASISGKGESDISLDGNHFVFAGDNTSVFVYEISTDTKGPVFNTSGRGFDSLYITPNNNVTITWLQSGTARYNGIEYFDRDMKFQRQVARAGGHMDVASDTNGDEVLLWTNSGDPTPICPNAIVKIRLSDAQQTCLISVDWSLAVHVSAPDSGDWFFMETYAPIDPAPSSAAWKPYTNEILQVKLDGTEVRRWTHHRSRPFTTYNYTPRAAASRDGSRIIFNSNFGLYGPSTLYTDVYLMVISASSTTLPPPPPPPPIPVQSRYEQTNTALSYSGTWWTNNLSSHSEGSAALTMDAGSRVTFTFEGTGISWIGYHDEWSGVARVYLDNSLIATVDTFASPATAQTVLYSVVGLPSASHTLVIEATGERNSQSGGSWVWVDALEVNSSSISESPNTSKIRVGYELIDTGIGAAMLRSFSGQNLVSEAAIRALEAANN